MNNFVNPDKDLYSPSALFPEDVIEDVIVCQGNIHPADGVEDYDDAGEIQMGLVINLQMDSETCEVLAKQLGAKCPPKQGTSGMIYEQLQEFFVLRVLDEYRSIMSIDLTVQSKVRVVLGHSFEVASSANEKRRVNFKPFDIIYLQRASSKKGGREWVSLKKLALYLKDPCIAYPEQSHRMMLRAGENRKLKSISSSLDHPFSPKSFSQSESLNSKSKDKERRRVTLSGPGADLVDVRRSHVAEYFLQQIRLLAEVCYGRNYDSIDVIRNQYAFAVLISIIKDETTVVSETYEKGGKIGKMDKAPSLKKAMTRMTRAVSVR